MNIAVIGAGTVGRALSTAFVRAGHTVVITSRDPEDAGSVAAATGATAVTTNAAAAAAAELEGLAFLNMALNIANNGSWQSGWKLVGAPASVPVAA